MKRSGVVRGRSCCGRSHGPDCVRCCSINSYFRIIALAPRQVGFFCLLYAATSCSCCVLRAFSFCRSCPLLPLSRGKISILADSTASLLKRNLPNDPPASQPPWPLLSGGALCRGPYWWRTTQCHTQPPFRYCLQRSCRSSVEVLKPTGSSLGGCMDHHYLKWPNCVMVEHSVRHPRSRVFVVRRESNDSGW